MDDRIDIALVLVWIEYVRTKYERQIFKCSFETIEVYLVVVAVSHSLP